MYISKEYLNIPEFENKTIKGGGVFNSFSRKFILTAPGSQKLSQWRLPSWFYPSGIKPPLTYHTDVSRWKVMDDFVLLNTVGKGQEFVLNCCSYPEAKEWLINLFS